MELKSCLKHQEKGGINTASDTSLPDSLNSGGNTSGQDNCFSTGINTEEELLEKELNIFTTITEAGECLPLIEVNGIEYEALEEKEKGEVEPDIPVFTPPPLKPNKVKRIRISKLKHENICEYCKRINCTCLKNVTVTAILTSHIVCVTHLAKCAEKNHLTVPAH